jgi:hypothetical protein
MYEITHQFGKQSNELSFYKMWMFIDPTAIAKTVLGESIP